MKQEKFNSILILAKRIGNLFLEVEDITNQLAEAIDRQDEISIELVANMRYEPLQRLQTADQAMREHLAELGEGEEGKRIRAILNGDVSLAKGDMEQVLAAQAVQNIQRHARLLEKDRIINQRIARNKSIYH